MNCRCASPIHRDFASDATSVDSSSDGSATMITAAAAPVAAGRAVHIRPRTAGRSRSLAVILPTCKASAPRRGHRRHGHLDRCPVRMRNSLAGVTGSEPYLPLPRRHPPDVTVDAATCLPLARPRGRRQPDQPLTPPGVGGESPHARVLGRRSVREQTASFRDTAEGQLLRLPSTHSRRKDWKSMRNYLESSGTAGPHRALAVGSLIATPGVASAAPCLQADLRSTSTRGDRRTGDRRPPKKYESGELAYIGARYDEIAPASRRRTRRVQWYDSLQHLRYDMGNEYELAPHERGVWPPKQWRSALRNRPKVSVQARKRGSGSKLVFVHAMVSADQLQRVRTMRVAATDRTTTTRRVLTCGSSTVTSDSSAARPRARTDATDRAVGRPVASWTHSGSAEFEPRRGSRATPADGVLDGVTGYGRGRDAGAQGRTGSRTTPRTR